MGLKKHLDKVVPSKFVSDLCKTTYAKSIYTRYHSSFIIPNINIDNDDPNYRFILWIFKKLYFPKYKSNFRELENTKFYDSIFLKTEKETRIYIDKSVYSRTMRDGTTIILSLTDDNNSNFDCAAIFNFYGKNHSCWYQKIWNMNTRYLTKDYYKDNHDKIRITEYLPERDVDGEKIQYKPRYIRIPFKSLDDMQIREKSNILKKLEIFAHSKKYFELYSIPYHYGFLFYGPPGTGKTSLSYSIAGYVKAIKTIIVNKDNFYRVQNLRLLNCNGRPYVFILDEIDSWFEDNNNERKESISVQLVNWIDTLENAFIIGTTNNISAIPNFLLRCGRFDSRFLIDNFNREEAEQFAKNIGVEPNAVLDDSGIYCPAKLQSDCLEEKILTVHNKLDEMDI